MCLVKAVLANEVTVVVNCNDLGSTIHMCCKSDISESCCAEEFVRIGIFELLYVRKGGIPHGLPTFHKIQHYLNVNSIIIL